MSSYSKSALAELVQKTCVQFGEFTLASGAKSHVYIDCRLATLASDGAALIAAGMLEVMKSIELDAVGGPTMGADPIVGAILGRAHEFGRSFRGFLVRKEAKDHGMGKLVEGPIKPGDRVVIVEDVATSGGSIIKAINAAQAAGLKVVHLITVLDRKAGAADAFAKLGIPFTSLLTVDDLQLRPPGQA